MTPLGGTAPSPPVLRPAAPTLTIHRRVREVRVSFSVEDQAGPLKNFAADAFTIYDDGRPVSSITAFSRDSDLPLRIGLLMDRSDSVSKSFGAQQQAAERFLQSVLRPEVDSIFLLDFTHKLTFRRVTAADAQILPAGLTALPTGGQTALYDAVYAAARSELMTAAEPGPVRRVIILLSDGEDNDSYHALDDAVRASQENDVSIYAITVHPDREQYPGDAVLRSLAEATGGRAFVLPNLKHLDAVFSEIQDQLRTQYSVAFHPALAQKCGYRTLIIQPHDPELRVRARQGYYGCAP